MNKDKTVRICFDCYQKNNQNPQIFKADIIDEIGISYKMFQKESSDHLFFHHSIKGEDNRNYILQLRIDPNGDDRGMFELDIDCIDEETSKHIKNKKEWHHPERINQKDGLYYDVDIPNICSKRFQVKNRTMKIECKEKIPLREKIKKLLSL